MTRHPFSYRLPGILGALAIAGLSPAAQAQPSDSPEEKTLPTVTVTVGKQSQALDAIAASVTMHDGESLEAEGVTRLESLEQITPGLTFQPFGQGGVNSPVMRGVSAQFFSFSSSTLLLVDGVPTLMAQGFDDGLLDLERVEVMRGPQSTLYGRNAEAGVISIHTRKPDNTPRAALSTELSSRSGRALRFSLSRPLVKDTLYASISGEWRQQDGFINNLTTGQREDDRERRNVKLALRWTPDTRTDATLRFARQEFHDGAALWGSPSSPRVTVRSNTPSWNRSTGDTLALDVAHEFGGGIKLRSITAYNSFHDRIQQDTDFQPAEMLYIARNHRFSNLSQELRLEGRAGTSRWLVGLYADRDDHDLLNTQKLPAAVSRSAASLRGQSTALFTNWTIPLGPQWTLEAGARVERTEIDFTPTGSASQSAGNTSVSPKLALQYQFTPSTQAYASISQGVRTGGFNVFVPAADYAAYTPEKLRSFEIGIKGTLAGQRLRYSAALYYMQMRQMQVQQMPMPGMVYITNAASGHSTGAEFELDWVMGQGWQLKSGLALNRTRFDRFQDGTNIYDGNRNPFAPDASGHVSLRYDAPAKWHVQAQMYGVGKVYLDAANRYSRNGYGMVNLQAGRSFGPWEISGYVRNATNKRYDAVGYQNGIVTVYSPPREFGVRLTWRL
ncbi:TonB-dependent receptor [Ottowia thiooxydans]|uniref:TonB-dependent receptor n=1 Tax=Ottowia thiooxydans TaxID=219182 RepID=UPI00042A6DE7|nr:TonB-dependent receptor [Ottowia thiooxydans]